MAGVRDIARAAGVSTATVSRVLSGSADVSEDLKKKVRAVAAALNYRPEQARRGKRKKSDPIDEHPLAASTAASGPAGAGGSVVLYVPGARAAALHDRTVGYFAYVFSGIMRKVEDTGLSLNITPYPGGQLKEVLRDDHLARLQGQGAIGLLFLFSNRDEDKLLIKTQPPLPWLALNRLLPEADLQVRTDERGGARDATRHLLEQGHTRIGVLAGPARYQFFEERLAGVREAYKEAGVTMPKDLVARAEHTVEGGRDMARQLFDMKNPPTALFATEEEFATGALMEADEREMVVPDQLSLVTFSDFVVSARRGKGVTAVSMPAFELGYLAVEALLNKSRISSPLTQEIILKPTLVMRDSVAAPSR